MLVFSDDEDPTLDRHVKRSLAGLSINQEGALILLSKLLRGLFDDLSHAPFKENLRWNRLLNLLVQSVLLSSFRLPHVVANELS